MPYNFDGPNDLYGVFNEERGVMLGDPYEPDKYKLSRYKGKQFGAPYQPKGNGPDAMIDKTTKLTIPGDTYIEPYSLQKDLSKRSSIHAKAFVPCGGTKKGGSGSLYGIFGPAKELLDTDPSLAARTSNLNKDGAPGKRNIYVSPAKKGTFGYPWQDRSIGNTKFEFIPDEYCRGRILEKELKKEARAKIVKPFVSTGRTGRGIQAIPYAPSSGPAEKDGASHANALRSSSAPPNRKAWRAPNPPQKGPGHGTINKLEYVPDPPRAHKYPGKDAPTPKGFKPPGGYHQRLSMWSVNPYAYAARPPPDNSISLLD